MTSPLIPATPDRLRELVASATPMLDVRAPVEYKRGALPGATNLPLMNDDERHAVGLCYKQSGADAAVRLGHELVSGEVREQRLRAWCDWVDQHPGGKLFCFRGGQRSAIVQQWLAERGRHIERVEGGYKALRQYLLSVFDSRGAQRPLLLLGGRTGTGKTRLLAQIPHSLDLEGIANHRGSAFGHRTCPQPPPATFENALAAGLLQHDSSTAQQRMPLVLEDESRLIGRLSLPEPLYENMRRAPIALVERPLEERVQITLEDYVIHGLAEYQQRDGETSGFASFADWLRDAMNRIRKRLGGVRHVELSDLLEQALAQQAHNGSAEGHRAWIRRLLEEYYDPMYDYQLQQKLDRLAFRGSAVAVVEWVREQQRINAA